MLVASIQEKLKKPLHIVFIIKIEFTYTQGEKKQNCGSGMVVYTYYLSRSGYRKIRSSRLPSFT